MLKPNEKQAVKAMKMLRRTFSPVLISDVAMQGSGTNVAMQGSGIFLRAELNGRKIDGFRSSYSRRELGLSCVLQQAYSTAKAGVFTAPEHIWKL